MKAFAVFIALFVASATANDSCYKQADGACSDPSIKSGFDGLTRCNASYGPINILGTEIIDYANDHIMRSFEYLLLATHFGNFEKNRPGFEKLFRNLADEKWATSIELIKHLTKRGGAMKFAPPRSLANNGVEQTQKRVYELYEIQSIAKALDIEKRSAIQAFYIHNKASERHGNSHDPEIAHYIEEKFVEGQADTVRKLAGYVTDLNSLMVGPDSSLSLYLFDEYLQKQ